MSKILAIETATEYGSVAIASEDKIFQREIKAPKQHSLKILSMIEEVLAEAGLKKTQLDAISFGRGPGSFTGIRLATSIAQTIAFGLGIPVIPVSTLQALAQRAWHEYQCEAVLVMLDARLGQVYWGCYHIDPKTHMMKPISDERLDYPKDVKWSKTLLTRYQGIGSGWDQYSQHLQGEWIADSYPNAYNTAIIGRYEYGENRGFTAVEVKPFYLRNQVAQPAS